VRKILTLFIVFFLFFLSFSTVDARSGCCSHHKGVCGCRCCDGTSLSSTCAPYYPSCSSGTSTIYTLPTTIPTRVPTKLPTKIPTKIPTRMPTTYAKSYDSNSGSKNNESGIGLLPAILGASGVGTIIYLANEGKK